MPTDELFDVRHELFIANTSLMIYRSVATRANTENTRFFPPIQITRSVVTPLLRYPGRANPSALVIQNEASSKTADNRGKDKNTNRMEAHARTNEQHFKNE